MRTLTNSQFRKLDDWMQQHARPYDRAKWNFLFHNGSKNAIVEEMLKYQNADGGMGHGFESDIRSPLSAAIPTAEAIFQTYEYGLDCTAPWFGKLLSYFENTISDIPAYWEACPKEAMNDPHAPWWNYSPCTTFTPNPCAAVASAFICYGTERQKNIGLKIAKDCFNLFLSHDFCGDHDTLNMIALVEQLKAIRSPLITEEIIIAAKRRISENICFDENKWEEYYFQPLDFISSPESIWYDTASQEIEKNIEYWIDHLNEQGVWTPNFSWGQDSDVSRQATKNWTGYITVKRAKILRNFNRIEFNNLSIQSSVRL